jgi:3-hydroxyisobutyrate dehydrogenase-like beta-hydroxyacid dehydrogenase
MADQTQSRDVSVIGLGNMGSALAEALISNGHRVTVWNRTASKCKPLSAAGASVAASVSEAVATAQIAVVCVIDHDASVSSIQTDDVAEALRGKLLVQLSTVSADESGEMGRWADANGIGYLDGSILAYPEMLKSPDSGCAIVYSGPRALFEMNRTVLESMNAKAEFVGETVGSAAVFDKTIYAYHYANMLAFFHGAAICHAARLPIETYFGQVKEHGTLAKIRFGEMIAKRSYEVSGASIELDAAAYKHVTMLSEELGVDTALPATVSGFLERAIAEGHGQQELAAIFELMVPSST